MNKLILILSQILLIFVTPMTDPSLLPNSREVRISMYTPTTKECGSSPSTTAGGYKIRDLNNASKLKWCAVSKDIPVRYGDSIYVEVKHSWYKVVDRCGIPNTVDILESIGSRPYLHKKSTIRW